MNPMLRWSPSRQFHFHQDVGELFGGSVPATRPVPDETTQRPAWLPATEGHIENGVYVIQVSLPGVDPKDVKVSLMDDVLMVEGDRKVGPDEAGREYFARELPYGAFQRSFQLPEGVDGAKVEAKHVNGLLELRFPTPLAAMPLIIAVKAA